VGEGGRGKQRRAKGGRDRTAQAPPAHTARAHTGTHAISHLACVSGVVPTCCRFSSPWPRSAALPLPAAPADRVSRGAAGSERNAYVRLMHSAPLPSPPLPSRAPLLSVPCSALAECRLAEMDSRGVSPSWPQEGKGTQCCVESLPATRTLTDTNRTLQAHTQNTRGRAADTCPTQEAQAGKGIRRKGQVPQLAEALVLKVDPPLEHQSLKRQH
jgi:hypothetical protein